MSDERSPYADDPAPQPAPVERRGHQVQPVTPAPPALSAEPGAEQETTPEPLRREEVGGTASGTLITTPNAAAASTAEVAAHSVPVITALTGTAERLPISTTAIPALATRGWLVPIGGRMEAASIIERFVELCGGDDSRIVVIPTASNEPGTGQWYQGIFCRHGAHDVQVVRMQRRGDRLTAEHREAIEHATGVFFTGGNQLKLATTIIGSPLADLLRSRYASGLHVAGTSAGAAFLSSHMIAFGQEGPAPHAAMVTTCGGLGLTERFIIDQHFRQRDRLGRLLTAVAYNPFVIGLGVDENTAVFISPDDVLEVIGEGAATVIDASDLDTTDILEALPGTAIALPGMRVSMLQAGEALALDTA